MSQVLVEEPRDRHVERLRDRDDHVERRIAPSVLDAGQVRAVDASASGDVTLEEARALAQVSDASSEADARWLSSVHDLPRHPITLWPQPRPTTSRRHHD